MNRCVIDATMGCRGGLFCFCPIEGDLDGDFTVVTGMMFLATEPPPGSECVAIVHADGQEAVDQFCEEWAEALVDVPRYGKALQNDSG